MWPVFKVDLLGCCAHQPDRRAGGAGRTEGFPQAAWLSFVTQCPNIWTRRKGANAHERWPLGGTPSGFIIYLGTISPQKTTKDFLRLLGCPGCAVLPIKPIVQLGKWPGTKWGWGKETNTGPVQGPALSNYSPALILRCLRFLAKKKSKKQKLILVNSKILWFLISTAPHSQQGEQDSSPRPISQMMVPSNRF